MKLSEVPQQPTMERWPPCHLCGSGGFPADTYTESYHYTLDLATGDETRTLIDHEAEFLCFDCAQLCPPDVPEDDWRESAKDWAPVEERRAEAEALRLDLTSPSYRGRNP